MILQTKAVVLSVRKYGETSVILNAYTAEKGTLAFISATRPNKKTNWNNCFQALSMLDITFYYSPSKEIHRIKSVNHAIDSIGSSIQQNAVKFFVAELLFKTLKEEEVNQGLFDFIWNTCSQINHDHSRLGELYVRFMYRLSFFLGVTPDLDENGEYFDLREGHFVTQKPLHEEYYLNIRNECKKLESNETMSKLERKKLLGFLLDCFKHQLDGFYTMKSLDVLESVFND